MSESITESSVEKNEMTFDHFICYSANYDQKLYEKYKAGERDNISWYDLHSMQVLSILDRLGYPMKQVGTRLLKELVIGVEQKIDLYDLNEPTEVKEDLEKAESTIRKDVSVDFLSISDNIFGRLISKSIAERDREHADEDLAKCIPGLENENSNIVAYNIAKYIRDTKKRAVEGRFTLTTFDGRDIHFRVRNFGDHSKMECPTLGISDIERMYLKPRFELKLQDGTTYVYDVPGNRKGTRSKLIQSFDIDKELLCKLKAEKMIKYSTDVAYLYGIGEVDENGEFHVDGNAFDIKTKGGAFHRSDPKKSLDLKLRGFFD